MADQSSTLEDRVNLLFEAFAVEQVLLRAICAALVARIADSNADATAARRQLAEEITALVDRYSVPGSGGAALQVDLERAWMNLDAILQMSDRRFDRPS